LAVETTVFEQPKMSRKKVGKYSTFRRKDFACLKSSAKGKGVL